MTNRCLTCGRGDLCQPCLDSTPPTPAAKATQYKDPWEPDRDQIRSHLASIPELYANLPGLTDITSNGERSANKPGSRALIRLDIRALTDSRLKDGWLNLDPAEIDQRLGTRQALWLWVYLLDSELEDDAQCPDDNTLTGLTAWLTHHLWFMITNHPCTCLTPIGKSHNLRACGSFAASITRMHAQLVAAKGDPTEPRFVCPKCGARMFLEAGQQWLVCDEGHSFSVRDLERQQRRRPALSTDDIVAEFGLTRQRLYDWHRRKKIKPAHTEGQRGLWWFPWDIICVLNPDLATAIDTRDREGLSEPAGKIGA